jgi:hypothetical protein
MSRTSSLAAWSAAAVAALLMTGTPANAQLPGSSRPYRGLFGADRTSTAPARRQALDLTAGLEGAFDDNLLASQRGGGLRLGRGTDIPSGYFGSAQAGLSYQWRTEPVSFYANTFSVARYYPEQESVTDFYSSSVGGAVTSGLWRHARLSVDPNLTYTSRERLRLIEVPDAEAGFLDQLDYATVDRRVLRYGLGVEVVQDLGRRTSLIASAAGRYADFASDDIDFRSATMSARLKRQVARNASIYAGYSRHVADHIGAGVPKRPMRRHSIDVGVDYGRALSLTRRTSLTFTTGSSLIARDRLDSPGDDGALRARLIGGATLIHELGRSWRAQAAYARSVRFTEEFGEPMLSDSASGGIAGYLSQRLDVSVVGAYSSGSSVADRGRQYETYTASAQLRYGLTRNIALFTQYLAYYYEFQEGLALLRNLPPGLHRQSVHAGVTLWTPLFR